MILGIAAIATAAVAFWPRPTRRPADEELYWQATMATAPADAERDLNSLIASYPASRRYDEALLRLAQLEISRGDRPSAVGHLNQLARHTTNGLTRTRAGLLASLAQLDGGDTTTACNNRPTAVDSADAVNPLVARDLETLNALCLARDSVVAAAATVIDSGPPAAGRGVTPPPTRGRGAANDTTRRPGIGRPRQPIVAPVRPAPSTTLPTTTPP